MRKWYYSLMMLVAYVGLFLFWKYSPSRIAFAGVGLTAATLLTVGLVWAKRRAYFVNRVDLFVHGYVIADIVLESLSFEGLRLLEPLAVVNQFHNNNNFIGCTLILTALIGGHRLYALSRASRNSLDQFDGPDMERGVEVQEAVGV